MTQVSEQPNTVDSGDWEVVLVPTEQAHIIYPFVPVGEKALTLCGKKWKVTTNNPSADTFTCRDCVDVAVDVMVDNERTIMLTTMAVGSLHEQVQAVIEETRAAIEAVTRPSLMADIVENGLAYQGKREAKAEAKALAAEQKAEAKIEKAHAKAKKQWAPEQIGGDDHEFSDAVEVRTLRAKGVPWETVSGILDMSVEDMKAVYKKVFGGKPIKGERV